MLDFNVSKIHTIERSDPRFLIRDNFTLTSRASLRISNNCPLEYQSILIQAINAGWIAPVAHVHERELLIMGLGDG